MVSPTNQPPSRVSETLDQLSNRARALVGSAGQRVMLGITGTPGSGKSTLAAALVAALGDEAVLVGMDGFHLANAELLRLGRRDRKGAPDTFDAAGYASLLSRLRDQTGGVVYAPRFDRGLEESIGSAVPVFAETPLVVTEGNYLLVDGGDWAAVRQCLDQVWYIDVDQEVRRHRLVGRRRGFGHHADEAEVWVRTVDEPNARFIEDTRERADLVVRPSFGT